MAQTLGISYQLQGLSQLINCTVTCCTRHHQAAYRKDKPAHAKQLYANQAAGTSRPAERPKSTWKRACLISDCPHLISNKKIGGLFEGLEAMSYKGSWGSGRQKYSSSLPSSIVKKTFITGEASQWKQAVLVAFFSSLWKTGEQEGQPATRRLRATVRKALHPLVFLTCTWSRGGSQGWRTELGAVTWCSRS